MRTASHRALIPTLALAAAACGGGGGDSGGGPSNSTPIVSTVTITPPAGASSTLNPGQTLQLSAAAKNQSGTTINASVTWASNAPTVATVSQTGLVSAVSSGTANITATATSGGSTVQSVFPVTVIVLPVLTSVTLSGTAALSIGATSQLTASPKDQNGSAMAGPVNIAWSSTTPSVATVSSTGLVTAVAVGTATITVTATSGTTSVQAALGISVAAAPPVLTSVTITPATVTVQAGSTLQLTANPKDQAGGAIAATIAWSSSATGVATVSQAGLVTGVAPGGATITAQASVGGVTISATRVLTVQQAIPILTSVPISGGTTVTAGQTLQLTASPLDQFGAPFSGAALSWSSSNSSRATVSNTGLVTGVAAGAVTISVDASLGTTTVLSNVGITVTSAFPASATFTAPAFPWQPMNVDIAVGGSVTWQALSGHDVTWDTPGSPSFIPGNDPTPTRTFNSAGTFAFHCSIHGPGMNGTVTVH